MRSSRSVEQSILVRNISSRGLGARTSGILPVEGEEVHLELILHWPKATPGGRQMLKCIWTDGP